MPAGRPLEPVGNGRPRWMAAGPRKRATEPGVQVDSSVAHLVDMRRVVSDLGG